MKTYKLYGEKHVLCATPSGELVGYAINGDVVDERPTSKFLGYINLDDGTSVECYKGFPNLIPALIAVICLIIVTLIAIAVVLITWPDPAIGGTILQTKQANNVVTFNGIPSLDTDTGTMDLRFNNGEEVAQIMVYGEDIECDPIVLQPRESIYDFPVKTTTTESVVEARLKIKTGSTEKEYSILIEIPNNMNGDTTGVGGFFDNEVIVHE